MIYEFLASYWGLLGAPILAIMAYVFGGKRAQYLANKKIIEETKIQAATAMAGMQDAYDKYIEHDRQRTEKLEKRIEILEEYNRDLQKVFNDMSLSYAVVMEQSKDWERKYTILEKEYTTLKSDHDKLKTEFDKYKRANKQ